MALKHVNLSTDVYFVCLNHAMSTDGEEIVGLLVGEVDEANKVAHVSAVVILRRSDKRKDRVEISPEQLSNASTEAERLACILKRPIRVIGWYHSHPKLTVWPSPIDVNTQDSYQLMDDSFIGVIFSVFNEDPNKKGGRIQMTCFQSQTLIDDCNIEKKRLDIPVHLVPSSCISNVCMNALIQLPRFLCQEEQLAYQMTNQVPLDYLTRLHNSSVYIKSMGQIAEVICGPLLKMLEERIINNEIKRKKLQERKKELMARLEQMRKEVDKMKTQEMNANVQPSADSSAATSKPTEENNVPPVCPVESNPLPQNKKDVPECAEASCCETVEKQPNVNEPDKISGDSSSVTMYESVISESDGNAIPKVDKCGVPKEPLSREELHSSSVSQSPNTEENVSVKNSNISAEN
ncbi:Lys-63-specific deubiquitinase BRCC36 [Araneus ventricosus]|uniref:Lys-63-specific deubiquitinase BRCC36 n=1 Tax=Araneus ventricosus TaxID=182803 RepID=A0A4Y2DWA2_ARAVE|nr:Lys-63-specific deubiquitinase BRCC36 [Araneus ventricosus]